MITACLASLATAPFTAQHFGSVTPWGIVANIVAVPLTGLLIMPAGLVLAISLPVGLEGISGHLMAMPVAGLVGIGAFFAELPGAGLLVRQPGFAVLPLLVSSVFAISLLRWPVAALGVVPGVVGAVLWVYAEDPKGVLFGMSRDKPLVLIKNKSQAIAYGHVSGFARDLASRRLGRLIINYVPAGCGHYCRHQIPSGVQIAVAVTRRGLTPACADRDIDVIIFRWRTKQLCRNYKPIYNFNLASDSNYLIFINKRLEMNLVNSSESSRQACPEPQPLHC